MKTDPSDQSCITNGPEPVSSHPKKSAEWVVYSTIADTTWRMFVPVLGGALIGYFIDKTTGSLPIGVITGTFIGVGLAVILVAMQYKQTTSRRTKP